MSRDSAIADGLQYKLGKLIQEHRALDEKITRLSLQPSHDDVLLYRLKKRKLQLKEEISVVENLLTPNIIA